MAKKLSSQKCKWLHISDIHIYDCTDWNFMLGGFEKLAKKLKPDFLVVTGDFRHKVDQPSYDKALDFLNHIVRIFNLNKEDVFLVPGNHDVDDLPLRNVVIEHIVPKIGDNPDAYTAFMHTGSESSLEKAFDSYNEFVQRFYENTIDDGRVKRPDSVWCIPWKRRSTFLG